MKAAALVAAVFVVAIACEADAQGGRLGNNVGGGGARSTGGSSMGFNRAGTASSGGFSYGDAPKTSPTVTVTQEATPAGLPCNVAPVSVDGMEYYKCGSSWYTPGLTATGIAYTQVAPPRGY